MKKNILLLLALSTLFLACEEEKPLQPEELTLRETTYGGCFQEASLKIYNKIQTDTLLIEASEFGLKLTTVMNYNCCGILADEYEIINDNVVNVYISDSCIDNCECVCICGFVFNAYFTDYQDKDIYFNIYLKGYKESDFTLWKTIEYLQ